MENQTELLSDVDIRILAKQFHINLIDVCFKSKLDTMKIKAGSYVLNMDRDDYQGTHWICLYVNGNNAVYYDSFGQEAPIEIVNFCKRGKVKLIMNYTQIQDIDDTSCGYYCLAFLYWMTKYKTPSQYYLNMFNKPFDENTKKNKLILQKFIKSIVYKKT